MNKEQKQADTNENIKNKLEIDSIESNDPSALYNVNPTGDYIPYINENTPSKVAPKSDNITHINASIHSSIENEDNSTLKIPASTDSKTAEDDTHHISESPVNRVLEPQSDKNDRDIQVPTTTTELEKQESLSDSQHPEKDNNETFQDITPEEFMKNIKYQIDHMIGEKSPLGYEISISNLRNIIELQKKLYYFEHDEENKHFPPAFFEQLNKKIDDSIKILLPKALLEIEAQITLLPKQLEHEYSDDKNKLQQHKNSLWTQYFEPIFLISDVLKTQEQRQSFEDLFNKMNKLFTDKENELKSHKEQELLDEKHKKQKSQGEPRIWVSKNDTDKKTKNDLGSSSNVQNNANESKTNPNPTQSIPTTLEEEFENIRKKNATLNFIKFESGFQPEQGVINISEPKEKISNGDIVLKGWAAEEFLKRIKVGEKIGVIIADLIKNPNPDVFEVKDNTSYDLKKFLAKIESEKLIKLLDEKMKLLDDKIEPKNKKPPLSDTDDGKAVKEYRKDKKEMFNNFKDTLKIDNMSYTLLNKLSERYFMQRRELRTSYAKEWQNNSLDNTGAVKEKIDNWTKKNKMDIEK